MIACRDSDSPRRSHYKLHKLKEITDYKPAAASFLQAAGQVNRA
jgi:hypothetical protein